MITKHLTQNQTNEYKDQILFEENVICVTNHNAESLVYGFYDWFQLALETLISQTEY